MKRLAFLSFTIATLIAPVQVQAQQYPVTIEQPEDCALALIQFEAAVTGLGNFFVTPDVRQIWRNHLANVYSTLPLAYQIEYGPQSCGKFNLLMSTFSQLPTFEREQYKREWAESLPAVFRFLVNPVLAAAQQAQQMQLPAQRRGNSETQNIDPEAELRTLLTNPNARLPGTPTPDDPLGVSRTIQNGLNQSASDTMTLMHSLNQH
jgi:hypothetical protein